MFVVKWNLIRLKQQKEEVISFIYWEMTSSLIYVDVKFHFFTNLSSSTSSATAIL